MIFDNKGLPRDTGASDWMDSSRLAGMVRLFDDKSKIPIDLYVVGDTQILESGIKITRTVNGAPTKKYVRYPFVENPYDFSRDQALCLVAGLYKAGFSFLVRKDYVNGKDIFMPSHMGHIRRCAKQKPNLLQKTWLWLDVFWNVYKNPMSEPNQLLSMIYVAHLQGEKSYLKFWLKHNKQWQESITEYWSGWRGETELAKLMIDTLTKSK